MYKRINTKRTGFVPPVMPAVEYECDHSYHPLDYYLKGGPDPNGEHLNFDNVTHSDSAEDLAAGCRVDAMCDPHTNYFDIVEHIGVENANKVSESAKANLAEE